MRSAFSLRMWRGPSDIRWIEDLIQCAVTAMIGVKFESVHMLDVKDIFPSEPLRKG
jgi:hypothetical protein